MLRCLDGVADYMEGKDESPICARDIRRIRVVLNNAWESIKILHEENEKLKAKIERDDTILEFLVGICEEAEINNHGRVGAAWLRTFCENQIYYKDK